MPKMKRAENLDRLSFFNSQLKNIIGKDKKSTKCQQKPLTKKQKKEKRRSK